MLRKKPFSQLISNAFKRQSTATKNTQPIPEQPDPKLSSSLGTILLMSCILATTSGCDNSNNSTKTAGSEAGGGGDGNSSSGESASSADQFAADAFGSRTAGYVLDACKLEIQDDFLAGKAVCINVEDEADRTECASEIDAEFEESGSLCQDQFDTRLSVCGKLGEARYDPDFDPENFVNPDDIGVTVAVNPYFPLVVGNRWVWEGGDEVIIDTVTSKTKLIEGVTCRVVLDVVEEDGEVIEITDDWFAQDVDGNVWYCGESARDFETFGGDNPKEPELVEIDGSWKAGVDNAKPGLIVPFSPTVGQAYREEVLLGDAEDFAEILSLSANESIASVEFSCE